MDFGKLQADIVKNLYKYADNPVAQDYKIYGEVSVDNHKYIPIVYKNWVVYLIPIKLFLLKESLQNGSNIVSRLFTDVYTASEITDTGIYKEHHNVQLKQLIKDDCSYIWLNPKLLKPFGNDIKYYNSDGNKDAVYIKDPWNNLLGVVLRVTNVPEIA